MAVIIIKSKHQIKRHFDKENRIIINNKIYQNMLTNLTKNEHHFSTINHFFECRREHVGKISFKNVSNYLS